MSCNSIVCLYQIRMYCTCLCARLAYSWKIYDHLTIPRSPRTPSMASYSRHLTQKYHQKSQKLGNPPKWPTEICCFSSETHRFVGSMFETSLFLCQQKWWYWFIWVWSWWKFIGAPFSWDKPKQKPFQYVRITRVDLMMTLAALQ